MVVGSLRSPISQASWSMATHAIMRWRVSKCWHSAFWLIASRTAIPSRKRPISFRLPLPHEQVAVHEGPSCPGSVAENRMRVKRHKSGSHRVLSRDGWPDYVFAFHDGETIGPRMLSRIGKQTGLTSDDL